MPAAEGCLAAWVGGSGLSLAPIQNVGLQVSNPVRDRDLVVPRSSECCGDKRHRCSPVGWQSRSDFTTRVAVYVGAARLDSSMNQVFRKQARVKTRECDCSCRYCE
jgi:hypothetical protein